MTTINSDGDEYDHVLPISNLNFNWKVSRHDTAYKTLIPVYHLSKHNLNAQWIKMSNWFSNRGVDWMSPTEQAITLPSGFYVYEGAFDIPESEISNELWICEMDMNLVYSADDFVSEIILNKELVYSCADDKNGCREEYRFESTKQIHGTIHKHSNLMQVIVYNKPQPIADAKNGIPNPSGFSMNKHKTTISIGVCNTKATLPDIVPSIDLITHLLFPGFIIFLFWRCFNSQYKNAVNNKYDSTAFTQENVSTCETNKMLATCDPTTEITKPNQLSSSTLLINTNIASLSAFEKTCNNNLPSPVYEKLISPLGTTEKVDVVSVSSNISSYSATTSDKNGSRLNSDHNACLSHAQVENSKLLKFTRRSPAIITPAMTIKNTTKGGSYEAEFDHKISSGKILVVGTSNDHDTSSFRTSSPNNMNSIRNNKIGSNVENMSPTYASKTDYSKYFKRESELYPSSFNRNLNKHTPSQPSVSLLVTGSGHGTAVVPCQSQATAVKEMTGNVQREQGWRDVALEDMIKL